ncbi:calcium-binding tyrosine phosphorylation-regulated protein isoform X2 [Rhinoderma darwinii]|uniref:calcium-binding tyrosine phosphorylation-regulated protein isoform X2 n=1 Tax=Rhinoderma darwinii TaxID=43563 RepID=UPI003F6618A9
MSTKPRLLVPYGLKTLLEGLSRAVVCTQPANIAQYASFYFTELLQYRHENTQVKFSPVEDSKSGIPDTPVAKDKAESEMIETETEQYSGDQDPCSGNASIPEDMPAVLEEAVKCSLLHRDISNLLVSAHAVSSQLQPGEKDSGPAVAACKVNVKCQQQEQASSGSAEQSAGDPERLDKVSSKKQSHSTTALKKKASLNGTVPKMSTGQAVNPTTRGQDLDEQYLLPRGVPSNGRLTDGATPSFTDLTPKTIISKLQNVANLPGVVSNASEHPPDQTHSSAEGSAIYLAKQNVGSPMQVAAPPTQGVAKLKIKSGPTEDQQSTTEMPSCNLYQIHISVDRSASGICYEPAYIPGKNASVVHIVASVPTRKTGPTMVPNEAGSAIKLTPRIQTPTLHCRHPSQDPGQYKAVGKLYAPYVQKKFYSPGEGNKQRYSDASSQSSVSELNHTCLNSVQRNSMDRLCNKGENEQVNHWTFYQDGDLRQMDPTVNSQCRTEHLPNQRSKYMQFPFCPCMSHPPLSNVQPVRMPSPTYMASDEAEQIASSPSIFVGSSEWKTENALPSRHEQDLQSFTKPNSGNQMQDLSFKQDPVYVSGAVPVEEVQRRSATPSITYLAEARSMHSFTEHGNAIAIAVAATRCPSVMDGLDHKQCARVKEFQNSEGCIRPSQT